MPCSHLWGAIEQPPHPYSRLRAYEDWGATATSDAAGKHPGQGLLPNPVAAHTALLEWFWWIENHPLVNIAGVRIAGAGQSKATPITLAGAHTLCRVTTSFFHLDLLRIPTPRGIRWMTSRLSFDRPGVTPIVEDGRNTATPVAPSVLRTKRCSFGSLLATGVDGAPSRWTETESLGASLRIGSNPLLPEVNQRIFRTCKLSILMRHE